jgi:hypothetical protein
MISAKYKLAFPLYEGYDLTTIVKKGEAIYNDFDNLNYLLKKYLLVLKDGDWYYVDSIGIKLKY